MTHQLEMRDMDFVSRVVYRALAIIFWFLVYPPHTAIRKFDVDIRKKVALTTFQEFGET